MAKVKGIDVYVDVNTGTTEVPVWTKVGGQRSATMAWKQEGIDTTDKDSGGFREKLPGIREVSIEFDAFMIESDAGFEQLKKGIIGATPALQECRIKTPSASYAGMFLIEGLDSEAALEDAASVSFSMTSSGAVEEA
jgi:predicted secreted protein